MKKSTLIFVSLIIIQLFIKAQDPLFLSTNQSLVYLNPSFAGNNGFIRNQASHLSQWTKLSTGYSTSLNTFDAYIKPMHAGIALSVMGDDQGRGTLKSFQAGITYAQYFFLLDKQMKIVPSLQVAYAQRSLDWNYLSYRDQIDHRFPQHWQGGFSLPYTRKYYLDFSGGLLVNYKRLYAGISVFHLNRPDIGLYRSFAIPILYSANASYNLVLSQNLQFNFSGRFVQQQPNRIGQLAVNVLAGKILTGLGYNTGLDNAFVSAGIRLQTFTALLTYANGFRNNSITAASWELSLSLNFKQEAPKGHIRNLETW